MKILSCFLVCMSAVAQAPSFPSPLEGTGRTCWGHLWHTETTLNWQLPFVQCKSAYTIESHDETHTVLKVTRGPACAFSRIDVIRPSDVDGTFWNVEGYVEAKDVGNIQAISQGCSMIEVDERSARVSQSATHYPRNRKRKASGATIK